MVEGVGALEGISQARGGLGVVTLGEMALEKKYYKIYRPG